MEWSDQELVREIRGGSGVAFERLMHRYRRLVYKVAYGYTGERESALDVTQDTFLKVHARIASFRGGGDARGWIATIAANEARNHQRAESRRPTRPLDEGSFVDSAPSQEEARARRQRAEELRRSLASLRPRPRLAVVLRYYADLSPGEIGSLLNCSDETVRNLLFRSLKKLRCVLARDEECVR